MSLLPWSESQAVFSTTPSEEMARKLKSLPQGDSRALAASSTAIALSIGSAFHDPGDDAAGRGRNTGWQTAYNTARMAIDFTKESSDMFPPLKAVVGAVSVLIKNYDQTSDNAEMVEEIEKRVQSLSGVLASPASEGDYAEKGRRTELRRKLRGVLAKLGPLSEQHALVRFLRNADNAKTLTGFVQELADAVMDYQISVQQGVYERAKNIHDDTKYTREAADSEFLEKLKPVHDAGYRAGHHNVCLPGTREFVLQKLMLWAKNPQDQNVFWLNGLAGTGKSTITQSFSVMVAEEGILGASFFCSRDYLDRKELKNIFPTIAYQLACRYPHFRRHLVSIIKNDPTLVHTSLISQLENLLVDPLSGESIPCVIIIDALDECVDDQPASAILSVLGRFVNQLPLVKFFVTGRPEPRIRTGFRLPLLEPLTQIFLLHEVESASVDNDIRLYLTQRLATVAKRRSDFNLPDPWPRDDEILTLTKKSSGLFIFASTLARFIESEHHEPDERLQLVVSEANNTTHEGRAGIDFLYSQILVHAFSDIRESEVFDTMKRVLGAIILAFNPLSQRELSTILGIRATLVSTTLRHLHSVILIPSDELKEIRVFHKSFPDFLQDRQRCTDLRFCVDPMTYHSDMALSCLNLVRELKRNPCSLPPFTTNHEVPNLQQLLECKLGGALRYACSHWARHLRLSPARDHYIDEVAVSATAMLKNSPTWIEVLSLENRLEEVIHSMNNLLDWLDEAKSFLDNVIARARHKAIRANLIMVVGARTMDPNTRAEAEARIEAANAEVTAEVERGASTKTLDDLAMDCLRFSMHFFHPIQQCAQHVYHTAVPLSPTSSRLRESYLQTVVDNRLSYVAAFSGAPGAWGSLLRTIDVRPMQLTCVATSGQRIVAACGDIVNIYDAVTFVLRQSIRAPEKVTKIRYSPNGSTLFFAHSSSVTTWDVQTGGLIRAFTVGSEISDIAVSTTHMACGSFDGSVVFWSVHTKGRGKRFRNDQPVVTLSWVSPQELAVMTRTTLHIRDIVVGGASDRLSISGRAWGMIYLEGKEEFLVGTTWLSSRGGQEKCSFVAARYTRRKLGPQDPGPTSDGVFTDVRQSRPRRGRLTSPTLVEGEIACITATNGVQLFSISSYDWTNIPPPLAAATSVAISLNRNPVVQTKDSIQIFSVDILTSCEARDDVSSSHIYPLGENHIVCLLKPTRHLNLLEFHTLEGLSPGNCPSLRSLLTDRSAAARASFGRGLVAELGISVVVEAWRYGTPLPRWTEDVDEDIPLCGWSPKYTRVVRFFGPPQPELQVCEQGAEGESIIASLHLEDDDLEGGMVYDLTFDSETRFYLKIDGPGWHVQIPYDVTPSPSGDHSHEIIEGEPESLSGPRIIPPYTLDVNREWVLDVKSRRICWISPGNIRRGNGGHFWAGLSLVMVGDDGVVRKLTFKEPDF